VVEATTLPLPITALSALAKRIEREYGQGCVMAQTGQFLLIATAGDGDPLGCWCHTCDGERRAVIQRAEGATWVEGLRSRMIVCPGCGNKRCPKANHHDNECTASNEPGQRGSAYTTVLEENRAEIIRVFDVPDAIRTIEVPDDGGEPDSRNG
jgi:hypothetical protein